MKKLTQEDIDTDKLVSQLFEVCPTDEDNAIKQIEKDFNCKIKVSIEKIHALQHTYYYDVDFGLEENFNIEISSGIDSGGEVLAEEWGYDTKPTSKTVRVLKDVILDESKYLGKTDFFKRKSQAILDRDKQLIFDHVRSNNYDNYVTGGHSKLKAEGLWTQLHLEYIYEEEEVDCNFI